MIETMIENVSNALKATQLPNGKIGADVLLEEEFVVFARAAIEAMEATEAMLIAAFSWDEHVGMEETYPMYRGIFRAMMKAALKEQTK